MGSTDRQEALNARLGLAYSLLKQGKRDQAIPHLSYLADQGYRPTETLPALMQALCKVSGGRRLRGATPNCRPNSAPNGKDG